MDLKKVKEIIELFETTKLSSMTLKEDDFEITLEQNLTSPANVVVEPVVTQTSNEVIEESAHLIKSPIVGTFYRAATPESKPFVEVGDTVNVGDVLCVIESMKMMNEITSDVKGVITQIHIENAKMVEFDQKLFSIEP